MFLLSLQIKSSPQTLRIVLNPKAVWSDGKKIGLADFVGQWRALKRQEPLIRNFEFTRLCKHQVHSGCEKALAKS